MCHIHSTYVKHLHIRTPHVSGTVFVYIQSTCVKHIHMHTYTQHILVHLHSRCTFSPCKRSQGLSGAVYLPASLSLHVACCLPLFFPHHPRLAPPSFKADYIPGKVPTNRTPPQYTTPRCITLQHAATRSNILQNTLKSANSRDTIHVSGDSVSTIFVLHINAHAHTDVFSGTLWRTLCGVG